MTLNLSILNFKKLEQITSQTKDSSSSLLSLGFMNENEDTTSFSKSKLFDSSSDESTISTSYSKKYINNSIYKKVRKDSLFKRKLRKDINGNLIEKGGKHKVSFKDDIKGNFLVEITFYSAKDNCLRRKNYKDYTFKRLAKDKKTKNSSGCNIF